MNGDRLFLDANVLFSAAYKAQSGLLRLWRLKHVVLVSSTSAVLEARRNLEPGPMQARLDKLVLRIELLAWSKSEVPGGIALADKDRHILSAALAARCTHLLTGDARHFGAHFGKRLAGIWVMRPSGYLASKEA